MRPTDLTDETNSLTQDIVELRQNVKDREGEIGELKQVLADVRQESTARTDQVQNLQHEIERVQVS